jgi:hypothetical protein
MAKITTMTPTSHNKVAPVSATFTTSLYPSFNVMGNIKNHIKPVSNRFRYNCMANKWRNVASASNSSEIRRRRME